MHMPGFACFTRRRYHWLVVFHLNAQSTARSEKTLDKVQSAEFHRLHHGRAPSVDAVDLASINVS